MNFLQKGAVPVTKFNFWNVFRVCMEFDFLSIEVIESQQWLKLSPEL